MTCGVCNHQDRAKIENAILAIDGVDFTIESIAEAFEVREEDVKLHAIMHMQVSTANGSTGTGEGEKPQESLAAKLKLREAQMLRDAAGSYYTTLKKLEMHIQQCIETSNRSFRATGEDAGIIPLSRLLDKSTVDAYLGSGNQMREAIKAIVDIDTVINDRAGGTGKAILDLISAIRGSKSKNGDQVE